MQVKLIVRSGSQAGKAVTLPIPQCLIGRSEECHIRPQLDAISRKHCVITTNENEVTVKDLGSRNGTYVNDERISGEAPPDYFLGPSWCLDKPAVRKALLAELERRDTWQGKRFGEQNPT